MRKLLLCLVFVLGCSASPPADIAVVPGGTWQPARVVRVLDGDTIEFVVELGWEVSVRSKGRLLGIDTPESTGATKALGLAARDFSASYLKACGEFVEIRNRGKEKYGRWLIDVKCPGSSELLSEALRNAGHVKGLIGQVDASTRG